MPLPPLSPERRLVWRAALVALGLLLLYLLSYSGLHSASDELSALAVVESWAGQGTLTTNQMEWEQSWAPSQNSPGPDGNLYSKKGVGVSLAIAPLFLLGKTLDPAGAIQVAKFGGPLFTALTAFWLFLTLAALQRRYGIGGKGDAPLAVWGTLAWGIATPAWAYARTLYSEPLAALGLSLVLWSLVHLSTSRRARFALLAGCGLAWVILTKSVDGVIALPVALYLAWRWLQDAQRGWQRWRWGLAFALPVALAIGLTILYNWVRLGTLLTVPLDPIERFSTPLGEGLLGQLLSPGKGLLWYAPILGLALPASRFWLKREGRALGLALLGSLLLPLLLFALWYDWPGGRAWGPRMILWTLPAWIVWSAPALAWLAQPKAGWRRLLLWSLLGLSLLAQLPGVLIHVGVQEGVDLASGVSREQLLWSWAHSPLLTYWQAMRWDQAAPTALDPLLAQHFVWTSFPWLAGALLLIGFGGWASGWHGWQRQKLRSSVSGLLLLALLLVLALGWLGRSDPRWHSMTEDPTAEQMVLRYVKENATAHDLVLLDQIAYMAPDRRAWNWMNWAPLQPTYLAWLRRSEMSEADRLQLTAWLQPYPRLWLVLSGTPEDDPASTTENFLNRWAGRGRQSWVGTQRIVEYLLPSPDAQPLNRGQAIDFDPSVRLTDFALYAGQLGDGYVLRLDWPPGLPDSLRFSVQALDSEGQLLHQVDGRLGQVTVGNTLANWVGIQSAPNQCRLILKIYDLNSGTLLHDGKEWIELCPTHKE